MHIDLILQIEAEITPGARQVKSIKHLKGAGSMALFSILSHVGKVANLGLLWV
jgi:hypothetical protein